MALITITLPKRYISLLGEQPGPKAADVALQSLQHGIQPFLPASTKGDTDSVGVYLSRIAEARLKGGYNGHRGALNFTKYVAGLIAAGLRERNSIKEHEKQSETAQSRAESLLSGVGKKRIEQIKALGSMLDALQSGRVLLAEASTGVGKSLCIAAAAYESARSHPESRVLVGAPTFSVMSHLVNEFDKLSEKHRIPQRVCLLGRNEYVSSVYLAELLDGGEELPSKKEAQDWLERGGPCSNPFGVRWLADDLERAAPGFPVQEALLRPSVDDKDDDGFVSYKKQFERAENARIVLATHAMIAQDLRTRLKNTADHRLDNADVALLRDQEEKAGRKAPPRYVFDNPVRLLHEEEDAGFIPDYDYALIDEAHDLENNIARALGSEVSIFSLRHACRQLGALSTAAEHGSEMVNKAWRELVELGDSVGDRVYLNSFSRNNEDLKPYFQALKRLHNGVLAVSQSAARGKTFKSSKSLRLLDHIRKDIQTLARILNEDGSPLLTSLSYTPVRRYPHLLCGEPSVARYLDYLWRRVKGGCAVSATLYLPVSKNELSPHYMAAVLAVPPEKLAIMVPQMPMWVREPVKVFLPEKTDPKGPLERMWLQPLQRNRRLHLTVTEQEKWQSKWRAEQADALVRIARGAKGGTLVLFTSYQDAIDIGKLAVERNASLEKRMIVASRDESIQQQRLRFLKLAETAAKPVWFATGAAWTGLDLNVVNLDPKEDYILTDLVIPKLPFGTTNTSTHQARLEKNNAWSAQAERYATAIKTKQGIGRLIRKEGVRDRRLFILDSRVHDPGMRGYVQPILDMLDRYPNVSVFRVE